MKIDILKVIPASSGWTYVALALTGSGALNTVDIDGKERAGEVHDWDEVRFIAQGHSGQIEITEQDFKYQLNKAQRPKASSYKL